MAKKRTKEAKEVQPADGLPKICYGVLPGTDDVVIIQRGVCGFWPTEFKGEAKANELNSAMGVTIAQVQAMMAGSMFGFGCPAANPLMYDESGNIRPHLINADQSQLN